MSTSREHFGALEQGRRAGNDDDDLAVVRPVEPSKLTTRDAAEVASAQVGAVEPGKLTLADLGRDVMPPPDAIAYAERALARLGRDDDGPGALASAIPIDDRRARLRLATADVQATVEMLGRLAAIGAPPAAVEALLAALPPHVVGPALRIHPDHWRPVGLRDASPLAAIVERRGAAIYRKSEHDDGDHDHPAVHTALTRRGSGEPLPYSLRRSMEAKFHTRFDRVRIHTDAAAADACRALGASAFTIGEDIYFAPHMFAEGGDSLLAHELTHVVQAQQGRTATRGLSHRGDPLEREAEDAASRIGTGEAIARDRAPVAAVATAPTAEMMLRADKQEITSLIESWFKATPFTINKGGQVSTQVQGSRIRVLGPTIDATSDVTLTLPDDKQIGSNAIKVGPIQTLLSSSRIGVYQKDGQTIEQPSTMGQARDAAEGQYSAGETPFSIEPPFYSGNPGPGQEPQNGKLLTWQGDSSPYTGQVILRDQPKFTLAKTLDSGHQLVSVKGSDQFNTSAGFKTQQGEILAIAPFGWALSWDSPIAADGTAHPDPARDAIATQKVDAAVVVNTKEYANLLARQEFTSVDAAMAETVWNLILMLPGVRARNPTSAGFIEQAITRKNGSFRVTVTAVRGVGQQSIAAGGVGSDDVNMKVSGTISKVGAEHDYTARQGTGGSPINLPVNEMLDPSALTESSILNLVVHEAGHLGGGVAIPFPFKGGGAIGQADGSEGDYRVQVDYAT